MHVVCANCWYKRVGEKLKGIMSDVLDDTCKREKLIEEEVKTEKKSTAVCTGTGGQENAPV